MYGSFNRSKNWPDNLNGYPTEECDRIDDCYYRPAKGSSCTDLPASSIDWDKDNDGNLILSIPLQMRLK